MMGRTGPKISSCKKSKNQTILNPIFFTKCTHLHDRICGCDVSNDGRGDEPLPLVALAADNHLAGGAVDERLQALEVALVDDSAKVRRLDGLVAEPFVQNALGSVDEGVLNLLCAEQVVGRDASLAHVDQFSPDDALGGDLNVARTIQVDRTETSKEFFSQISYFPFKSVF
jgi:hypothetical protein